MGKIFQILEKKLGRSAINATFSMDAYENNVLTWWLFLASSMKAAIHLGPDFLMNSEIYKNTEFENVWSVFNIIRKLIKEHSEETLNTVMDEVNIGQWSSGQVGEGKSMCLRWFRSLRRTGERCFRSNRKMERPSCRSQEVFVVPRCSGTRRRTDWVRLETFHRIFVIICSSRDPERLGDKEHRATILQGPDHLHVNVQRRWVEKMMRIVFRMPKKSGIVQWNSRVGREMLWRFSRKKEQWCCTANKMVQRFKETWILRQMYHSLQWRFQKIQNSCSKQFA